MAFSTLTGAIRIDASGVSEGVDDAEEEIDSLTGRFQSAGQRMQSAGAAMTAGITAPLLAMGGMAAKQAASFDQAMQKSIAVMGDVDEAMREDLEQTAREVATSTTASHQQAAESFYFLASAGLTAAESMEAMPQVAAFAEAGQMNMAEATDVATNVMSAFGYEASQMNEVTDTLTATVTGHNQTMQGMADAMSRVAPTAAGMGVEIEEAAAAIGLLGDVGIQGQRAGTALNRALTVLSNPTGRAAERINELGVSVRNSNGDLRSITEIMADFEAAGADSADMAAIFGTEAGPAMSSLLQQGTGALQQSISRLREAEGATRSVAQTQRDTLNAELQIMRSNLEDAGVAIGANFLPMLSTLSGHVKRAGQWFANLSDRQQKMAIATGAVAAAAGPLLMVGGTLLTMLPAMASGFTMVTAAAAPVTAPILAIVGAVGLLSAAYATDFMGIRSTTANVVGGVMDNLDLLKGWFLTAIGPIGWLYMAWESNFLGIQNRTAQAKDLILSNLDLIVDGLLALMGPVGWVVVAYRRNIGGFGDATDEVVDDVVEGINWLIERITQIPTELQNLIDRIPGVDGEEVADKLFPPKPAADKASETGGEMGSAARDSAESAVQNGGDLSEEMFANSNPEVEPTTGSGEEAGQQWAQSFEQAASPMVSPSVESSDGPIKGEMTSSMRSVLESGVYGYISDPERIEDAPTEIDENLFDAMAASQGGATADRLGVSEQEFATLVNRFGGGGYATASSSTRGMATSSNFSPTSTSSSSALSVSDIAAAVREALADLVLEGELNVADDEFDRLVDPRVRAVLADEADRLERGGN